MLRVQYHASDKPSQESQWLKECLEKGPPLQNLMWNILVGNRFKTNAITADNQKAFFQIKLRESDRDVLRFQWKKNQDINELTS